MHNPNLPLVDQDAFYIIGDQIGDDAFAGSPWSMEQWHPEGAHFFHARIDANVIVTTWTTQGVADVTTYTDYQLANMEEWTATTQMPLETLGRDIIDLLATLESPAPIASPVELAADYMRQVRRNGPTYMRNVADCWRRDGHHELHEIPWEIQEMIDSSDVTTLKFDSTVEACRKAAVLAIEAFHAEIGDAATGHRNADFDRLAGSPLDALATLVIRK